MPGSGINTTPSRPTWLFRQRGPPATSEILHLLPAVPHTCTVDLDLNQVLAIIGICVGVAAIIAGVLAARRWGTRRRRLLFEYTSTPLIPKGQTADFLKVTYRDFEVEDPHLVRLSLKNVGSVDVATAHFDAGRPLTVALHCTMYGVTSTSHPAATESPAVGTEASVKLRPTLLPRGQGWVVEAVVGGLPRPEVVSTLVDTDILDKPTFNSQLSHSLPGVLARALNPALGADLIADVVSGMVKGASGRRP